MKVLIPPFCLRFQSSHQQETHISLVFSPSKNEKQILRSKKIVISIKTKSNMNLQTGSNYKNNVKEILNFLTKRVVWGTTKDDAF